MIEITVEQANTGESGLNAAGWAAMSDGSLFGYVPDLRIQMAAIQALGATVNGLTRDELIELLSVQVPTPLAASRKRRTSWLVDLVLVSSFVCMDESGRYSLCAVD